MRRGFGDALMSLAALLVLVLMLAVIDARVREQIWLRLGSATAASAQMTDAGVTARNLANLIFSAVRDQSIEHGPLVLFVIAALVLVFFMLRT